jgi:hypothetical protein
VSGAIGSVVPVALFRLTNNDLGKPGDEDERI